MKKEFVLLAIIVAIIPSVRAHQDLQITRQPPETLEQFGRRITPAGMELAHPVVEGDFGNAKGNVVLLFHKERYREFIGWVLVPEGAGYKKFVLPEVRLPVSTEIEAVFFDNADHDAEKELLILCKHISGVGRYPGNMTPFWTTYVYDWNGNGFTSLDDVSTKLDAVGHTRTVSGVRRLLRKQGY
jgi:hypothetical protein